MDAAARQRLADGQAATTQATGRLQTRTAELLRAALRTEEVERGGYAPRVSSAGLGLVASDMRDAHLAARGVPAAGAGIGATASASPPAAEGRVERALALVERIERFVRSGRPSLALTLRGDIPGHLEVQRVAPGAIALRLSSARAPSTAELGALRQALEARGLEVRTLEARRLTTSAEDACSPCP